MATILQEILPVSDGQKQAEHDAHRDPLSGRAGSHPFGTGAGATAGAAVGVATGAVVGAVAGPLGMAVGAVVGGTAGAIGGGLAGKALAEEVNPTVEHGFWRECFTSRSYYLTGMSYEDYAPAYQFGWESQACHRDGTFDQAESKLQRDWEHVKGSSKLCWNDAKEAVRDSWNRVFLRRSGRTK